MKFILSIFVVLLFTAHSTRSYDTSLNYILNPDFSVPNQGNNRWANVAKAGAWSETSNKIEIGYAKIYNPKWANGQLIELDSTKNSNVYQIINLDAGYYQLSVTWAPRQGQPLATSQWSVYWNDILVQLFVPNDYNIRTETLVLKAIQGANKLSLRGEGSSNGYGAGIKYVSLFGQNYIQNAYFENPDTHGGWQIFKSAGQWSSYTNEIEIGLGTIYNSVWKTGQITELDVNTNAQIYQLVFIPAGKYHLRFNWAARSGVPLTSSGFSVWWNGTRLTLTTATDYLLQTFIADVEVTCQGNNTLTLRGEGTVDGLGVGVDNVRLWRAV